MGKAVEHLIAASFILASGLELNVSTSFVDDEGVDLIFHRRESSTTLAVQVKSRSHDAKTVTRNEFLAQVGASTFRPRADLHLLFVVVDSQQGTFGPCWLIPSVTFAERKKPNAKNRRVFGASLKPDTKDWWSEFRYERPGLPGRILGVLDSLAQRPRLQDAGEPDEGVS